MVRVTTYSCDNPDCLDVVDPKDSAEWWSIKVTFPRSRSTTEFRWHFSDDELTFCSLACLMSVTSVMHDRYSE